MRMHDTAFLAALMSAAIPAKAQQTQHTPLPRPDSMPRVAVAAHDLSRGTVLSATDITWTTDSLTTRAVTRSARLATSVAPGWIVRRNIRAGERLDEPGVGRPDLVVSGDPVDVIYLDEGVSIKLRGTAIGSGAQGDAVYVKLDNRRRLRGVVTRTNTVRIL